MIAGEFDESPHPFWQVFVGFMLTLAALTAIVVIAVRFAEPGHDKPIVLGILGLACLLVHPRVWWIWELHGIKMLRELAGDIPVLVAYRAIGLAFIAYSVYGLVTTPDCIAANARPRASMSPGGGVRSRLFDSVNHPVPAIAEPPEGDGGVSGRSTRSPSRRKETLRKRLYRRK